MDAEPATPAPPPAPATRSALWPTALLALGLALPKAVQWELPDLSWGRLSDWVSDLSASAHEDLLFALGTGASFQAAFWLARRRPALGLALHRLLLGWGAACVAYAVASVQVFAYLRSPLTYPLLYIAGDMKSMRSSLGAFVDWRIVVAVLLAPLLWLLLAAWAGRRLPPWPRGTTGRAGLALAGLGMAALVAFGWSTAAGRWRDRADHLISENPHAALLGSCLKEALGVRARTLDVPYGPDDLLDFELPVRRQPRAVRPFQGKPPRNVILLVLETTGTRYLSAYGSKYPTTPVLEAERKNTLAFDNVYSHVGLTSNAMAAITLSVFPYMTWREYTVEYPRLPGKTLAQVFKEHGRRTAFLHTGDLEYVGQDQFLDRRGFDTIWDRDQVSPGGGGTSWGAEDRHLVDGMLRWIDQEKGRPFYLMAWTIQAHHPYDPSPDQPFIDFFGKDLPPDDYDLGRYLNTLREVDRQLGRLFEGLRARKLADDTLVVITGDHGESFGFPHEAWGHGSRVYQEAVNVPLVVWSPRLVKRGRHLKTIGAHVDINPTVTDLAGLPADDSWHGRSMFDPGRPPRAYFYAANDDYLLGVREDGFKYVYNATSGREELFDLTRDPDEQHNVADQHPVKCQQLRRRVAAWRAHEAEHLASLRQRMPPPPAPGEPEPGVAAGSAAASGPTVPVPAAAATRAP